MEGQARWRGIETLAELGEATAEWLEGDLVYHPTYGGPPERETSDIIPALATMNRKGFVTDTSQPGVPPDGAGNAQRAYVDGLCSPEVAGRLVSYLNQTELVVLAFPPSKSGSGQVVVTLVGGDEFTWCGTHFPEGIVQDYGDHMGQQLADVVRDSWTLQIIDPVWGRNDLLWPSILLALTGSDTAGC